MQIGSLQILIITSVFIFCGCGVNVYTPNSINTPALNGKGDLNVNLGSVVYSPETMLDFQGAYAFSDHGAVLANASFMNGGSTQQILLEGGGGVFTSFLKNSKDYKVGRVGMYGGYGFASLEDRDASLRQEIFGRYQRLYAQPVLGLHDEFFEGILSVRISNIFFSDYRVYLNGVINENNNFGFVTVEPIFTFSFGVKGLKFYFQTGSIFSPMGKGFEKVSTDLKGRKLNLGLRMKPWGKKKKDIPSLNFGSVYQKVSEDSIINERQLELAPFEVIVNSPEITICFKKIGGGDYPEKIKVSWGGVYNSRLISLSETPFCFDVELKENKRHRLFVGRNMEDFSFDTSIFLNIKSKKENKQFYIRPKKEKGEIIWIRYEKN